MTKRFLTILILLTITGCATSGKRIIALQHPETKQTVQCSADPWATFDQKGATEQCAVDYEALGFVRAGN